MKLTVTTPRSIVLAIDDLISVRAEDESGSFGILPGHADFLTVLPASILSCRGADGRERFVAVQGGVLVVRGGTDVLVASPEALADDDLDHLERLIVAVGDKATEEEHQARTDAARLQIAAIRHIQRYIEAGRNVRAGADGP